MFVSRPSHFTAIAHIKGEEVRCYLPNTGRMLELRIPGAKIILEEVAGKCRKISHDLIAVYVGDTLVSIDSRVPNRLILAALKERKLVAFTQYTTVEPEYVYEHKQD